MKAPNRDLLVLVKNHRYDEEAMELEIAQLHRLLMEVETSRTFSCVYEIIDMNRYKIHTDGRKVIRYINEGEKPFIFFNNKN
ncbi:hypothetical protein KJS94_14040 [Flavihumibacter rivuli]|uniref:hypothetical protein n=1 Tax=Flavihumibacter rivuli TaxID=2838156 RepID=UPI001BDE5B1F|nr:hypothetical protein [Flavihumibacter rivuli]ULQ55765.1 hypothetical protein KJS94_14040 [Flavihumibacter rivuli]